MYSMVWVKSPDVRLYAYLFDNGSLYCQVPIFEELGVVSGFWIHVEVVLQEETLGRPAL